MTNETIVEDLIVSRVPSETPSRDGLLPVGTAVGSRMSDRATGVIVGYNTSTGLFYTPDRYPYIIRWCDGYQDCYGIDGVDVFTL